MTQQKESLGIISELNDYKVGDHVFTAEFGSDDGKNCAFKVIEFEIKKIVENTLADGKPGKSYVEMTDVRFPKSIIKSDLKTGFFNSEKEAIDAFMESINFLYASAHKAYDEKYGNN